MIYLLSNILDALIYLSPRIINKHINLNAEVFMVSMSQKKSFLRTKITEKGVNMTASNAA